MILAADICAFMHIHNFFLRLKSHRFDTYQHKSKLYQPHVVTHIKIVFFFCFASLERYQKLSVQLNSRFNFCFARRFIQCIWLFEKQDYFVFARNEPMKSSRIMKLLQYFQLRWCCWYLIQKFEHQNHFANSGDSF